MSETDESFTRAAYDAARDAELEAGGQVVVVLRLSAQRGVWVARSSVVRASEDGGETRTVSTESTFPNARALTLGSFLFAQMNILAQMTSEARAYATRMRDTRA
jgi:hypothetical protein